MGVVQAEKWGPEGSPLGEVILTISVTHNWIRLADYGSGMNETKPN